MVKTIKILEHTFYLTKPSFTIVDLGSNIGQFRNQCFDILGSAHIDRYIGVEPNTVLYDNHLKDKNDHVTKFYNNAIVSSLGAKKVNFYAIESNHECGNIIGKDNFLWQEEPKAVSIDTTTLETIIRENNLKKIDYLKIDIEGAEYELIRNMTSAEAKYIRQVSIEFHDFVDPKLRTKTYDAIAKLNSLGFTMVHSAGLNYMHTTHYADCLFINKKLL